MSEETNSAEYDRLFWNDAYKSDPDQTIVRDFFLEEESDRLPAGKALDVGCGTGENALMLARKGWSVLGIDWAEEAVAIANETARADGLDARFLAADSTKWDTSERFDLVYSCFALPEGVGRKRAVRNMINSLTAGGTLIIIEWDKKMARSWGFEEDSLPSPSDLTALAGELEVDVAETRKVANAFQDDPMRGQNVDDAFIVFIRARKLAA